MYEAKSNPTSRVHLMCVTVNNHEVVEIADDMLNSPS